MSKFAIRTVSSGIKFDLKATNGQVILASEVYTTKAACVAGAESIKKNCVGEVEDQTVTPVVEQKHPKFELYQDKAGEFRFRLKARNGEVILSSDDHCYGGQGRVWHQTYTATKQPDGRIGFQVYLPQRTAIVLKKLAKKAKKTAEK